jgi:hypothetical protein
MKKSVITRAIIILTVLLVWGISIFPYQDQPYFEVLDKNAVDIDAKYSEVVDAAKRKHEGEAGDPAQALKDALNVKSETVPR